MTNGGSGITMTCPKCRSNLRALDGHIIYPLCAGCMDGGFSEWRDFVTSKESFLAAKNLLESPRIPDELRIQMLEKRIVDLESELKLNDECDTDCRELLCEERDAAERIRDIYRDGLRNIANANTRDWDDPTDFKAWAQSRARFVLGDK